MAEYTKVIKSRAHMYKGMEGQAAADPLKQKNERRGHMASPVQVILIILLLCAVSFAFGWTAREFKGTKACKLKRFRVKRRLNPKPYGFYKLPIRYDWKGNIY